MKIRLYTLPTLIILGLALSSEGGHAMNASKKLKIRPNKYMQKIAVPKIIKSFHTSLPTRTYLKVMEEWAHIKKQVEITPCNQFFKNRLAEVQARFLEPSLFFGAETYLIKVLNEVKELVYQEKDNFFSLHFVQERITKIVPPLEILTIECNSAVEEDVLLLLKDLKDGGKSFDDLINTVDSIIYTIQSQKYRVTY